jgi:hypothetical protein
MFFLATHFGSDLQGLSDFIFAAGLFQMELVIVGYLAKRNGLG